MKYVAAMHHTSQGTSDGESAQLLPQRDGWAIGKHTLEDIVAEDLIARQWVKALPTFSHLVLLLSHLSDEETKAREVK